MSEQLKMTFGEYGELVKPEKASIIFQGREEDILVLRPNGDILVHGKLVENDKEVVEGMREFLKDWGRM